MFRTVAMPARVAGKLYLHSLPGRYEPWAESSAALARLEIGRIVSVMPEREALEKSAPYARAAAANELPCVRTVVAIKEYDVPQDRPAFYAVVDDVAASLRDGERVLVHCAAGRGRTGMFAMCVLISLGLGRREAERAVMAAGSRPESGDQMRIVTGMAKLRRPSLLATLRARLRI